MSHDDHNLILEGIMTTIQPDGTVNISPMGPFVEAEMQSLVLRPFKSSTTCANLKRTGAGVFHVTDDVEMLAWAAVGRLDPLPELLPVSSFEGKIIASACRWYALRVRSLDDRDERVRIVADVVDRGRIRDFFGFNRAKHAVVEAAILATRIEFLPLDEIHREYERLKTLVDKTGGEPEHRAFRFLEDYVRQTAQPVGRQ